MKLNLLFFILILALPPLHLFLSFRKIRQNSKPLDTSHLFTTMFTLMGKAIGFAVLYPFVMMFLHSFLYFQIFHLSTPTGQEGGMLDGILIILTLPVNIALAIIFSINIYFSNKKLTAV